MLPKILLVDDDPKILETHALLLKGHYQVETAQDGPSGLAAIKKMGEPTLIMTDFNMPDMDGIEFLKKAEEISPYSTRIMLTAYGELEVAVKAVNEGHIFRFLTKPCEPETLIKACAAGVRQYQLVTAERDLLEKTLHGGFKLLTEILALANPIAFSRGARIRRYVHHIATQLRLPNVWQFDLAAMLSQIGAISIPPAIWDKVASDQPLSKKEAGMLAAQPRIVSALLSNVPRLESVAGMIEHQAQRFQRHTTSSNLQAEDEILLGAHILRTALEFDRLVSGGATHEGAVAELRAPEHEIVPEVLDALMNQEEAVSGRIIKAVSVNELDTTMILDEDVISREGALLATKGQEVTLMMIQQLINFVHQTGVVEPIHVVVPPFAPEKGT